MVSREVAEPVEASSLYGGAPFVERPMAPLPVDDGSFVKTEGTCNLTFFAMIPSTSRIVALF